MTRYMVDIDVPYVITVEAESEGEAIKLAKRKLPRNVKRREMCIDVTDLDEVDRCNQRLDDLFAKGPTGQGDSNG